jgi:hypothetical protein
MRRAFFVLAIVATLVAGCEKPGAKATRRESGASAVADADTPRTCRDWTVRTATLQCAAAVLKTQSPDANARRIAAAEAKVARYQDLGSDLCTASGDAKDLRDAAAADATSDAATRIALDRLTEPSAVVSLCRQEVETLVQRREENASGRRALAEAHPHIDDTPQESAP